MHIYREIWCAVLNFLPAIFLLDNKVMCFPVLAFGLDVGHHVLLVQNHQLSPGMRIFRFLADFRFLHGQFGHSCNLYRSAIKNIRG